MIVTDARVRAYARTLLFTAAVITAAACNKSSGGPVDPATYDVFVRRGVTHELEVDVTLANAPPSSEPLDVLFLFDSTSSMSNVIEVVRSAAADIMAEVGRLSFNASFAVASFADYTPGDAPWTLHSDFSVDTARVHAALAAVRLQNGGDIPEAYTRALYEAQFLSWRQDARHFIILFGDAPAHDREFYGTDYGVDAGRDGLKGTADDLRLRPTVESLRERSLAVIAVHENPGWFSAKTGLRDAIRGFQFMAERTGGLTVSTGSARDVPNAIKAGLREQFLSQPTLTPTADYAAWVSIREPARVKGTPRFRFRVDLRAPTDAGSGIHRFALVAHPSRNLADQAVEVGRTAMRVRLGWAAFEWRKILAPLYVLGLLLLLLRRSLLSGAERLLWNRLWLSLARRALVVLLALAGLWLLWRFAPGTLP